MWGVALALALGLTFAAAQTKPVPVEERPVGQQSGALPQQQRTGAAWRAMQQAIHDARLAEQDYVNTRDAHRAAQQRADALKAELEKTAKAHDAAKAKEAAARKAYEEELKRQ